MENETHGIISEDSSTALVKYQLGSRFSKDGYEFTLTVK